MGARVIKIEQPGKGDDTRAWGPPFVDGESAYFLSVNRNKESVTLDFKHADGRALLDALVAKADVLVENFRPGTLARLGLDYDDAGGAISAAGLLLDLRLRPDRTAPEARPGYDAVMQAEGGLMSITGAADGPPFRLGVAIADIVVRHVRGAGRAGGAARARADAAADSRSTSRCSTPSVALLTLPGRQLLRDAARRRRASGNRHPSIAPYDTFAAADGDVRAGGRQRRSVAALLRGRRPAGRTSGSRPTGSACGLRRAAAVRSADRLRDTAAAVLDRPADARPGVPCGIGARPSTSCSPIRRLAAREMIVMLEHATVGPLKVLGAPVEALGHAGRGAHAAADARTTHGRRAEPRSRNGRRRDRRAAPKAGHLTAMETSLVRRRLTETIERAKKQAAERRARATNRQRAISICSSRRSPFRSSGRSPAS